MSKQKMGTLMGSAQVSTFLGLPAVDAPDQANASVILGAPCATPYQSVGAYCAAAPTAIRAAISDYAANIGHMDFDFGEPLFPYGVDAVDMGDLGFDESDSQGNRDRIMAAVSAVLDANAVPVVLGGDDSIPIPVIAAFEGRGDFVVLQIDAHIDWRDEVRGEVVGFLLTKEQKAFIPQ